MSLPEDEGFPLGCLEVDEAACAAFPVYGDVPDQPVYTREQLLSFAVESKPEPDASHGYVHDQNGYGMCTNSATTSGIEETAIAQGLPLVKLSAGDLYRRSGGGRDNGSTLTSALRFAMTEGVATIQTVPYLDWRNSHGSEAAADRAKHKILEAFWAPSPLHYFSGLHEGFRGVCGISWPGSSMDGNGWLTGRGGRGGHALMSFQVMRQGNRLGAGTKNSWKRSFGLDGFCVIPEQLLGDHFGGCFLIRSVTDAGVQR